MRIAVLCRRLHGQAKPFAQPVHHRAGFVSQGMGIVFADRRNRADLLLHANAQTLDILKELIRRVGIFLGQLQLAGARLRADAGHHAGAAEQVHFFQQDYVHAQLRGMQGGRHARRAAADHYQLRLRIFRNGGVLLQAVVGKHGGISARHGQRFIHSPQQDVAGVGCGGHRIHIRALRLQNFRNQNGDRLIAQTDGFALYRDLNVRNGGLVHGYHHGHGRIQAIGLHRIGPGRKALLARRFAIQGIGEGGQNRFAGDGRAGNAVDIHAIGRHNLLGHLLNRLATDSRRLLIALNDAIRNYAIFHGDRYFDFAAKTLCGAAERFRLRHGNAKHQAACQNQCYKCSPFFLHR